MSKEPYTCPKSPVKESYTHLQSAQDQTDRTEEHAPTVKKALYMSKEPCKRDMHSPVFVKRTLYMSKEPCFIGTAKLGAASLNCPNSYREARTYTYTF